jgi:phage tail sheath gpL-like
MTISLSEIAANKRRPSINIEHAYSGITNRGISDNVVVLLGEILAAGTASDGDISDLISDEADATAFAGAGSILEYTAKRALRQTGGQSVKLRLAAVAEPAGVQADGTYTFVGNASSDGVTELRIADFIWETTILNTYTPTQSAQAVVDAYDALTADRKLPVTVSNAVGVVTVQMNNKGTIGNTVKLEVIKHTPGTQTCAATGVTLGAGAGTLGTLEPTLTTILANLAAVDTDFLACSMIDADGTTGSLDLIRDHMIAKGNATNMLGGFWVSGFEDTVSNTTTHADTIDTNNCERGIIPCCEDTASWEPAIAAWTAVIAANEPDCARPLNGLLYNEMEAPASTSRYTDAEVETLLSYGLTPIVAKDDTNCQLERCCVIRRDILDPLDYTKIRTLDEFRDRCKANLETNVGRVKLKRSGETIYTSTCATPESVLGIITAVYQAMVFEDKLQSFEALTDRFVAENAGNGRVNYLAPTDVVDGLHVIAGKQVLVLSL